MSDVVSLLSQIEDTGRDTRGPGYQRSGFSNTERELRDWFLAEAARRGLDTEIDDNGITWAWATAPGDNAVVTGSHLDSVPGGGAFDGPLGVASALAAFDELKSSGALERAQRPLALAVFPEEEGSRFGVACLGSRLIAGAIDSDRALRLTDANGDTFADVARGYGLDPNRIGTDTARLEKVGSFIELHVEQGIGLINTDQPVAIGSSIIGHGRWHFSFAGQGNHAGTTPMGHRADPVVAASRVIGDIPTLAAATDASAVATVGRTLIHPGGTNVIASGMSFWLDIRHADDAVVKQVLETISKRAREHAEGAGVEVSISQESYSPTTYFTAELNSRLTSVLPDAPLLPSGAGHDAGILAPHVPSAMLYVRNPTGVSHAPEEACEVDDQRAGVSALVKVLEGELGAAS
ncbi:allantoate amidohydrolase [Brevibacterium aurantiacum]|uniref:N-carbamoyl-L-amino-acid hydrolase n=1 Tax=Brevibacterium aurantiacum TaxID=273384 RepID=A0A2H1JXD8_BREAU|nr:allantoate amidohydrolase [Brevibacterium aurantiacum]GEB24174.1 Zn-dependent hydrolase [Brevibacterium aurantiacum]SMX92110.1 N-carbamoyl-L-amino-acid hydrolase [Brevibacterium aurantiacum]